MKKVLLLLAAVVAMGAAVPAVAQQKKTVKKTVAKKAPAKKGVQKKAVQAVAPLDISDGEFLTNGKAAMLGIPVKQPKAAVEAALKGKGFKFDADISCWKGSAHGVSVGIFIDDTNQMTCRELKGWTKQQAFKRFQSYCKQITAVTGALPDSYPTDMSVEGVMVTLKGDGVVYIVSCQNEDEVDFSSKYFNILVTVRQE